MDNTMNNCLYLIYNDTKIGLDIYTNDFYLYHNDLLVLHANYISYKKILCIANSEVVITWRIEKNDDTMPSIKIEDKIFCIGDNKDDNQMRLFNELLESTIFA